MIFGIEKCAMLIMRSGKRQLNEGIDILRNTQKGKRKLTSTLKYWKRSLFGKLR